LEIEERMYPVLDLPSQEFSRTNDRTADPHRPAYHYLPPANWLNDPNGLIQWQGQYHLFYQYNPNGPFHGTIHWGHAVSDDLVHWTDLPIALTPTPGSADQDGCFSGCAVDNGGIPTMIYTGVRGEQQLPCIATSADGLRSWEKHAGNPVIAAPPPGLDLVAFRDHVVWKEGDTWYQLIGSGIKDVGGTALLYTSQDLLRWEYLHPIYVGDKHQADPVWTGSMWECPDFFPLGDRHILVVSAWDNERTLYPVYFVGAYADHKYIPERLQKLDFGMSFYAPQTLRDDRGRRIMWGWLREERSVQSQHAAGWSGVMSLPRELMLGPDGHMTMRPVPELATLRADRMACESRTIPADHTIVLPEVGGDTLELVVALAPSGSGRCGVAVRRAPDGSEQTTILYDSTLRQLIVDCSRSSLDPATDRGRHVAPLSLGPGELVQLHIFLDRSVIEVFANERASITSRIYPVRPDSVTVALLAEESDARFSALEAWRLRSIWAE
jgi:beta-fructofuranosidase